MMSEALGRVSVLALGCVNPLVAALDWLETSTPDLTNDGEGAGEIRHHK